MAPSASASIERAVTPAGRPRLLPRPRLLLRLLHTILLLATPALGLGLFLLHAHYLGGNGPLLLNEAADEQTVFVGLLLFVSAGVSHWLLRRRYQRFFRSAGQALRALGEKPSLAAAQGVAESGQGVDAE